MGFPQKGMVRRLLAWDISLWGKDKREISKELEFLGKVTGSPCVLRWIHPFPKSWLFSSGRQERTGEIREAGVVL